MSIKKVISLSVLLYVNVFMLGNIIIPHHHHGLERICFYVHCEECAHEYQEYATDDVYIPANKCIKNSCCSYTGCDCGQALYALISKSVNMSALNTKLPFPHKPYLPSFHAEHISQSLGLRAPPFLN